MTEQMRTYVPKGREAEDLTVGKNWFVVDAKGQVLGRWRRAVARLLIGKDKPSYTPYLDCGDHVIVINAEKREADREQDRSEDVSPPQRISGRIEGNSDPGAAADAVRKRSCAKRCWGCCRRTSSARVARRSCVFMPEVKRLARHAGQKPQPLAL